MNALRQHSLATLARRGALLAAVVASLAACGGGAGADEGDLLLEDSVTVRPRVAIDGLIELSARTGGRLFVDEVVFHAPSVQIRNGPFVLSDLIETASGSADGLFFRYALADGGGVGAIASERRWSLTPPGATEESAVTFGFAPFEPSAAELDEVLARTGWDLGPLAGYTAVVHGFVSMEELGLRQAKGDYRPDRRMAGDAEGDPAHRGAPNGSEAMAGDAEGDPAEGLEMTGDAEGDPADGARAAGDGEGDPAEGALAAGDGEGDPAEGTGHKRAAFDDDSASHGLQRPGGGADGELIPFLLVLDGSLELAVPLMELGLADLGQDEFLPIDLRVDVNRLLPDDRLAALDDVAAQVQAGTPGAVAVLEVEPREASRSFALDLDTAEKRTKPESDDRRLELAGDPRDDAAR